MKLEGIVPGAFLIEMWLGILLIIDMIRLVKLNY